MVSETSRKISISMDPLAPDITKISDYNHQKKVSNYLIGDVIGKGAFGTVNEALHSLTTEKVAIKSINKTLCIKDTYVKKHLRREGKILQQLRHPNIVHLLEIMETEHTYYLVLELCNCSIMTKVLENIRLSERETRGYIRQLILAVDYLHKLSIMHRDLKVENILLTKDDILKVADFGVSIQLLDQNATSVKSISSKDDNTSYQRNLCKTQCGSPAYAAPEILSRSLYEYSADVWSIGINMFAMLTGRLPFTVKPFDIQALRDKMLIGDMNKLPDDITSDCRNLLHQFLQPEPSKRITLREAMQTHWINDEHVSMWSHGPRTCDINSVLICYMEDNLGFRKLDTIKSVLQHMSNSSYATYYLLMNKAQRLCKMENIPISIWLQAKCPIVPADKEKKALPKLTPFNEITNSKSSNHVHGQEIPKPKTCEERYLRSSQYQNNTPITGKYTCGRLGSEAHPQVVNVNNHRSAIDGNIKLGKFANNSRILPRINEVNIPYLTLIHPSIVRKSLIFNPSRAFTTVQTYPNRKLSVSEDIRTISKYPLQNNLGRGKEDKVLFSSKYISTRRSSLGSYMKSNDTTINR